MRQRFPRYSIQVPVFFRRLDQEEPPQAGIGMTEDLGEGGASLLLEAQLPTGCRLGLLFFAFGEGEIVESEGRVAFSQARDRDTFYYDVEFIQLTPGHLTSLLKVLPQEKSFRRQAVRIPITLHVSCQVVGTDIPPLEGRTHDISRIGVQLILPMTLAPQTPLEITLYYLQKERITGVVRWVNPLDDGSGHFSHGVEFADGPLPPDVFSNLVLGAFTKGKNERS